MLILTRKLDESIVIGNDIVVKIVSIAGKVHLGISAPREISIYRQEVYELVESGNREAVAMKRDEFQNTLLAGLVKRTRKSRPEQASTDGQAQPARAGEERQELPGTGNSVPPGNG